MLLHVRPAPERQGLWTWGGLPQLPQPRPQPGSSGNRDGWMAKTGNGRLSGNNTPRHTSRPAVTGFLSRFELRSKPGHSPIYLPAFLQSLLPTKLLRIHGREPTDSMRPSTTRIRTALRTARHRGFATSACRLDKYGFIGLGQMTTVITVLPEPSHVKSVYASILSEIAPSASRLFIDCSTIDPSTSKAVATSITSSSHGSFLDAPMSGGLANNYLLALNNIATAEAMNLGVKWGLDPAVLAGVINVSTGKCWPSEVNNPVAGVVDGSPAGRDYSGGFGIGLMKKDLGLAIVAAEEAGARLELAAKAREVYESAEKQEDCKGRDFSVVYRWLGGESK
ncbi:3-hydroxyisobutyrate dehydrogenase [Verticillium alfalfae VaMs.102]|uniref:3-hydroxyisobutyrate dehydrogenase n=1 Tax=Verticillium alfalfae (strain VaMs.102 / ATCC MYA-4576 / FGSC 10136) TaxID=526221 RepID=C9S7D9_VERA1|nr:3-hydroxyisobutyrate dehydrogenase [Verticillium alfalfae VaMs.102]EEY15235.1 3-hydroxyisobutyrate dehydrogenase [Verticillium alfalfae VaMs.102]